MVNDLSAVRELWVTWVRILGQEDPLEKEMATHSSILSLEIPWMEKPGRLQSVESITVINMLEFLSIILLLGVCPPCFSFFCSPFLPSCVLFECFYYSLLISLFLTISLCVDFICCSGNYDIHTFK